MPERQNAGAYPAARAEFQALPPDQQTQERFNEILQKHSIGRGSEDPNPYVEDLGKAALFAANPLVVGTTFAGAKAAEAAGVALPGLDLGNILGSPARINPGDVYRPNAPDTTGLDEISRRASGMGAGFVGRGLQRFDNPSQAPQATAATINQGEVARGRMMGGAARGLQLENIGRLTAAAEGTVPSAAETQLNRGLEMGLQNQAALANSARGGAAAQVAARRGAANTGAMMTAQTNQQAAELRANEQAAARQALTGATGALRGADIQRLGFEGGLATSQAGFEQQVGMLNPQLALDQQRTDNQLTTSLLGLGLDAQKVAAMTTSEKAQLMLDYESMLTNRDLKIGEINVGADSKERAARFGAAGDVLGFGSKFLAGGV